MNEQKAIAQLKQGDIGGLEALVELYYLPALRAAYLITRDQPAAEDVVQTAFVRVYERISQFDASRPFRPWFLRSVVNGAIKAAMRCERHLSLEAEAADEVTALAEFLIDPSQGPVDLAEVADTRQAVWRALRRLSPRQRAAIVQRYYLGLSEAEMAEKLSISPGSVKRHLHAARKQLRALLSPFKFFKRGTL